MLRKLLHRPSPGTALAFVALVLAMSPLADAGVHAISAARRQASNIPARARFADRAGIATTARFADNAARVNGFRAGFDPAPRTLLALDSSGHFPPSAFPTGVQGPPGAPGAPGSVGTERFVFTLGNNSADPTQPASAFAACKANERVVGGGYVDATGVTKFDKNSGLPSSPPTGPSSGNNEVEETVPLQQADGTTGWFAQLTNIPAPGGTAVAVQVQAWAICRG